MRRRRRGGAGGEGGGLRLGDRDLLLGLGEERDGGADGRGLAGGDEDGGEEAVVEGLDVHVGLVGLDDDDGVALGESVSLGGGPGDDLALGHGGAERRHEDLPDLGLDTASAAGRGRPRRARAAAQRGRRGEKRRLEVEEAGHCGVAGEGEGKGAWRGGFERSLMRWWWLGCCCCCSWRGAAALGVSEARRISRGRRGVQRFGLVAPAALGIAPTSPTFPPVLFTIFFS